VNVGGKAYRTIWQREDGRTVEIIDQTRLPHEFVTVVLRTLDDAVHAIRSMQVRGAPLIGVAAAYGVCLALGVDESDESLNAAYAALLASRPTAINLRWALGTMRGALSGAAGDDRVAVAYETAARIADDDVASCKAIGEHGAEHDEVGSRERSRLDPQCVIGISDRALKLLLKPSDRREIRLFGRNRITADTVKYRQLLLDRASFPDSLDRLRGGPNLIERGQTCRENDGVARLCHGFEKREEIEISGGDLVRSDLMP